MNDVFVLSKKNQVTIPKWVRAALNVHAHQGITFKRTPHHQVVITGVSKKNRKDAFWDKMDANSRKYGSDSTPEVDWGHDVGSEKID